MNPRNLLKGSFDAALVAADPALAVPPHLPQPPEGRTLVIGAGKAAAAMALAVEQHWPAGAPLDGLVITRYGHGLLTSRITVVEAAHPIPDETGARAATEILRRVRQLTPADRLLAVFSGGGSALLSLPAEGISTDELRATTRELLRSGAPIQAVNAVRKHLSAVLGGRLAAACRAPVTALLVSDVTGDDPTHIASGPCAPDPTTYADALHVLRRYGVTAPPAVVARLEAGVRGHAPETPKPDSAAFRHVENRVVAAAQHSLDAAARYFAAQGVPTAVLGDTVTGEAREVAKVYAALAREVRKRARPWPPPVALISGGETTVTVRGSGRGGRNCEFLLSLAHELADTEGVYALACDTDGIDGTEDNAGAMLAPDMVRRAAALGLDTAQYLEENDGYGYFRALDALVMTGPTRTNVNDYRVLLVT